MVLMLRPKGNEDDKDGWNGVKIMFANPIAFINDLKNYEKRLKYLTQKTVDRINKLKEQNSEELAKIENVNASAAAIYSWVNNTINYYGVYKKVEPMQQKVEEMN